MLRSSRGRLKGRRVGEYDPSRISIEEISIDRIDTDLEEMEAASVLYFKMFADSFPDDRLSGLFDIMREEELTHQRMLKFIREYKKKPSEGL